MSPFRSQRLPKAAARKEQGVHAAVREKLYCSKAMVLLLQYLRVNAPVFGPINAKNIHPAGMFK
eukprot:3446037-Rhodomonas_salina.1